MKVAEMLRQPGRQWHGNTAASEEEIALLRSQARSELPAEYLDLLRFSNGGEGPLALSPLWFQLYPVSDCLDLCHRGSVLKDFRDFMFFGSNGGLESLAFDLRGNQPWPIVAIDKVAGPSSAEQIAANMAEFVQAVGAGLSNVP